MILLITMLPFTAVFFWYTNRTIINIDNQNALGYQNSLEIFCKGIENTILNVNGFLYHECWSSSHISLLNDSTVEEERQKAQLGLSSLAYNFLNGNSDVSGVFFYNPGQQYQELHLQSGLSYSQTESTELLSVLTNVEVLAEKRNLGWFMTKETSHPYWLRMIQKEGTYVICFIDMDRLTASAQTTYGLAAPIVFAQNNVPFTNALWLRQYKDEQLKPSKNGEYYLLESGEKSYMVVMRSCISFKAIYAVQYQKNTTWIYLTAMIYIGATALAFFIIWRFLQRLFFRPLYALVGTMRDIQAGDFSLRSHTKDSGEEFAVINHTFNGMLDTISTLKIESYEQKLFAERTEMDALRLQIRPHLFLNCLKAIYGLAQSEQTQDIQKMVIRLSGHLRYTLNLRANTIALRQELEMCRNYIELQSIGQRIQPRCMITIDDALREIPVPPITLLTLMENAGKFAVLQNIALTVEISVHTLEIDDTHLAQIVIQDNGPGFPADILALLNSRLEELACDGHVGIINIVRRFRLMYPDFSVFFSNQNGARIEMMIPVVEAEKEALP